MDYLGKVKQARISAIKRKDIEISGILAYILSTAQSTAKTKKQEIDDNEILQLIKTEIKSLKSSMSGIKEKINGVETGIIHQLSHEKLLEYQYKIDELEKILPKQLTSDEIDSILNDLAKNGYDTMGAIQKHFKENYLGLYNGAELANSIKILVTNK